MKPFKKHYLPHAIKYPLFFLGLLVLIGGGVGVQMAGLPLMAEVSTAVVGFVLLFLGIVLE
ncbi:MAG: hypothetical protein JRN52_14535 [Nitrososphaerota archaeon]|nr:hypothetical protein [Nitrososphaerota archaeon]